MDTRMLANKGFLETLDERLAALPQVDAGEMKAEEAAMEETLRDDISQDSLAEILTESREDLLMIGLRVRRSELSLDQPVCIQVELCTTMVSWSTLETAAQFEIARGNSSATGTFDPNQVTRLLTGTSHEPINAGLPVYGCEAHYQRVRVWLPVLCGHFFTLSETGFSPKQVLALYAILARLSDSPAASSQRARVFLAQLSRLLHRIAGDDALLAELRLPADQRPRVLLRRFVTDTRSH
ncbi:MAG TPA: hypothetical protein VJB16_06005, partial [archaeon]|nr:hypothetical protein [archaeon]